MTIHAFKETVQPAAPFILTPRSRILVVDDDFVNRKIWEEVLQGRYTLYFAENGKQALDIFKKHQPHLVVLDRMMPGMHGDEVLQKIRAMDPYDDTKIVMHSMLESTQDQLDGMHKGADLYIPKSTDIDIAVTQIQSLLKFQKNDQAALLFKIARDQYRKGGFAGFHIAENIYRHSALLHDDIETETLDLVPLTQAIIEEAQNALANAVITFTTPLKDAPIIGNKDMLSHSLYAVIRHSIMLSSTQAAHLDIALHQKEQAIELTLHDQASQLDPSQWNDLFRFECSEERIQIGLPIAWETAQRHYGRLTLSHGGIGNLYCFTFPTPEKLNALLNT